MNLKSYLQNVSSEVEKKTFPGGQNSPFVALIPVRLNINILLFSGHGIPLAFVNRVAPHIVIFRTQEQKNVHGREADKSRITPPIEWCIVRAVDLGLG